MKPLDEVEISKTIVCTYHERLLDRMASDVIIVGAGPSGLVAGYCLARAGLKVTVLEKRLAPGGGIWGGGMAMNVAVVQDDAISLLDELGIRCQPRRGNLHAVDAIELAAGLCWNALQAGEVPRGVVEIGARDRDELATVGALRAARESDSAWR